MPRKSKNGPFKLSGRKSLFSSMFQAEEVGREGFQGSSDQEFLDDNPEVVMGDYMNMAGGMGGMAFDGINYMLDKQSRKKKVKARKTATKGVFRKLKK